MHELPSGLQVRENFGDNFLIYRFTLAHPGISTKTKPLRPGVWVQSYMHGVFMSSSHRTLFPFDGKLLFNPCDPPFVLFSSLVIQLQTLDLNFGFNEHVQHSIHH
jgi:hypothetical protein